MLRSRTVLNVAAVLGVVCFALTACSGNSKVPTLASTPVSTTPGNGFASSSSGVPRSPQALSTAPPHTWHTYTIPNCSNCYPHGIAVGPDRLYYVLFNGNKVGSVTYGGAMGEQITTSAKPNEIAEGINGGMYIAQEGSAGLGELAQDSFGGNIFGSWNDFGVTTLGTGGVVSDPNGVLWYSEFFNDSVVRMTTYGSLLTRTAVTAGSGPDRLAVGPDNNSVYVTEYKANKIAKFDLSGNLLNETSVTQGNSPLFIASSPDGYVYFTEYMGSTCSGPGYIGKLSQTGTLTMIQTPSCGNNGITVGSDGNMWFTETNKGYIAQLNTTTDAITEYALPSGLGTSYPFAIVSGMDGQLWMTTQNAPYVLSFQP